MVSRIQTKAGSDTFGNLTMDAILARESRQVMGQGIVGGGQQAARNTGGLMVALVNLPSRVMGKGFSDWMSGVAGRQKDAYMDLLISHIVDGRKRVALDAALESVSGTAYLISQTFARGGAEALTSLFNGLSRDERAQQFKARGDEVIQERQQERQQEQQQGLNGQIEGTTPTALNLPLFGEAASSKASPVPFFLTEQGGNLEPAGGLVSMRPSTGGFDLSLSPTIVPSEADREIAMRMMQARNSGIAGLV